MRLEGLVDRRAGDVRNQVRHRGVRRLRDDLEHLLARVASLEQRGYLPGRPTPAAYQLPRERRDRFEP